LNMLHTHRHPFHLLHLEQTKAFQFSIIFFLSLGPMFDANIQASTHLIWFLVGFLCNYK
jgi:hypothetical protein